MKSTSNLRILFFAPALAPYRVSIYNEIGAIFKLKIFFLSDNLFNQKFNQIALRSRLKICHEYMRGGFDLMRRRIRFGYGREIKKFRPEIVMTCEFSPATIGVFLYKIFSQGSFRHLIWTDDNPKSMERDSGFRKIIRRVMIPYLDGFVFTTHEAADHYSLRFGLTAPIAVVPIIQLESEFHNELVDSKGEALKLIIDNVLSGKRILLFVGRLAEEKCIDRIIIAFAMVAALKKDVILVLVGEGDARESLIGLVGKLGLKELVVFAGRHEGVRLAAWYRIGGVFVLTSEFEPFGAVVNEALLAGMPVVCSNKAGAKSLIVNGWNGTVVDPENFAALQEALLYWIERCSPLSISSLSSLRQSLMPIQFQDAVDAYINIFNLVAGPAAYDDS